MQVRKEFLLQKKLILFLLSPAIPAADSPKVVTVLVPKNAPIIVEETSANIIFPSPS